MSRNAGLKKKVYLHLLRHSQLTKIAKKKSDSVLKGYAGWAGSSRMPRVYVQLSNADVEREMLDFHGVAEEEEKEESPLKPKDCPRCGFKNQLDLDTVQGAAWPWTLKPISKLRGNARKR